MRRDKGQSIRAGNRKLLLGLALVAALVSAMASATVGQSTPMSISGLSHDGLVATLVNGVPSAISEQLESGGAQLDIEGALLVSHASVGLVGFIPTIGSPAGGVQTARGSGGSAYLGILYLSENVGGVRLPGGYYALHLAGSNKDVVAIDGVGNEHGAGAIHTYDDSRVWEVDFGVLFYYIVEGSTSKASGSRGGFAVGGFSPA